MLHRIPAKACLQTPLGKAFQDDGDVKLFNSSSAAMRIFEVDYVRTPVPWICSVSMYKGAAHLLVSHKNR